MPDPESGKQTEYILSWQLNKLCNFRCKYCFFDHNELSREHPDCGTKSPDEIADRLDETGKHWHVHMSGGETFLYPRFVDLCSAFTRNHVISLNTNLSTSNVNRFANDIDPGKVRFINASLHLHERNKRA